MKLPPDLDQLDYEHVQQIANDQLLILSEDSGTGLGICRFAGAMMWDDQKPETPDKDWKSVFVLKTPLSKYTKSELIMILKLAQIITDDYDTRWKWRMGANIHILDKATHPCPKPWIYKAISWTTHGWYETLSDIGKYVIQIHPQVREKIEAVL